MAWWIVSVLAALASIVSLGLSLVEAIGLWPVLSILVVAVAILAMALRSALLRSPVFCTSTTIRLLLDETGAVVPLEKTQTFIALKRHITRFEERIASNLPVDDLVAEIEGLGSSVRILEQTGGDTCFAHEVARPLRPLKRYVRHVRYTLRDCFKGKDEWYEIAVLY